MKDTFYFFIRKSTLPFIKFFWIKKISNIEYLKHSGSAIIVANHSSYFDFLSLAAISPKNIYFLAAEKFFTNPIWSLLMRSTGQIKVDRKAKDKESVYKEVDLVLTQNKFLGIFPEGTRSGNGKIGKIYSGAAAFALAHNVPIIPIGIIGAFETMSRHDKIPRFKKAIEINIGKPIYLKNEDNESPEDLMALVMKEVASLSNQKI